VHVDLDDLAPRGPINEAEAFGKGTTDKSCIRTCENAGLTKVKAIITTTGEFATALSRLAAWK